MKLTSQVESLSKHDIFLRRGVKNLTFLMNSWACQTEGIQAKRRGHRNIPERPIFNPRSEVGQNCSDRIIHASVFLN
jgi:hypothetical protein